ncbi:hypothetical protein PanWU01x14_057280, partial [Parasponia andersonii]
MTGVGLSAAGSGCGSVRQANRGIVRWRARSAEASLSPFLSSPQCEKELFSG